MYAQFYAAATSLRLAPSPRCIVPPCPETLTLDFSAYEFSSLQEGQFTLHRGLSDRLEPILLVACSDEYPSPRSLQRLEHEHALRADLDAEWAARPIELIRREGRLTLVLEDPGGRPLERMLGRPMDMTQFCVSRSRLRP
jgi:hypothetical protein